MTSAFRLFSDQLLDVQQQPSNSDDSQGINTQALYSALLNNELIAQFGMNNSNIAHHIQACYLTAIVNCRKSNMTDAYAQLTDADALIKNLPSDATDYITLFKLSGWSYYYYKVNKYKTAVKLIEEGLYISAALERKGFGALIYRRIEQLHNIATIYSKQDQINLADEIVKNSVNFMHCGDVSGLIIDDWDVSTMNKFRILRESTLDATFQDIAVSNNLRMNHSAYHNEYYYKFFFKDLLVEMNTDTYNRIILYNWMYVKASFFEQGLNTFLQNTIEFLNDSEIAPMYDVFKANLLVQVALYAKQHCSAVDSKMFINQIKSFTESHLNLQAKKVGHLILN